jgi:hypothetical protein
MVALKFGTAAHSIRRNASRYSSRTRIKSSSGNVSRVTALLAARMGAIVRCRALWVEFTPASPDNLSRQPWLYGTRAQQNSDLGKQTPERSKNIEVDTNRTISTKHIRVVLGNGLDDQQSRRSVVNFGTQSSFKSGSLGVWGVRQQLGERAEKLLSSESVVQGYFPPVERHR